jgi:hypothetical protein
MSETFPTNQPKKEEDVLSGAPEFVMAPDGTLMRVENGKLNEDQRETIEEERKDLS